MSRRFHNAWGQRPVHGFLAISAAITLLACGGNKEPSAPPGPPVRPPEPPAIVLLSRSALTLSAGGVEQLTARVFDSQGRTTSASVEWSSADPVVATVGKTDGIVTAIAVGSTIVTAAVGTHRATVTVSVLPDSVEAQWAIGATASTEYTPGDWSAMQSTGEPNVTGCVDDPHAWASKSQGGVDWLELTYARPVRPSEIRIHEVSGVGSIVKVEVKDGSGAYQTVYTAVPTVTQGCPRILTIAISGVTAMVSAVRVSVDQRALFDWNEIDAVRLTGYR